MAGLGTSQLLVLLCWGGGVVSPKATSCVHPSVLLSPVGCSAPRLCPAPSECGKARLGSPRRLWGDALLHLMLSV